MTTAKKYRAEYFFRNGNLLLLPKHGVAPMFFLEFIREYTSAEKRSVHFSVEHTYPADDPDLFYIRMEFEARDTFADAVSFINSKLLNFKQL